MSTVSVPVSELTGPALDWAVEKCEYIWDQANPAPFSSDWRLGGPIIERELIAIEPPRSYQLGTGGLVIINEWVANVKGGSGRLIYQRGPTALVAAMRCRVASKLGSTVDIPAELVI